MKLSLVVLAVLCGVALSSPVAKNNVDGLLDDLLKVLKREENSGQGPPDAGSSGKGPAGEGSSGQGPPGEGSSGQGPPSGKDSKSRDMDEDQKEAVKGKRKDLKKAKFFAQMCGQELSKEVFMTPVALKDVGVAYSKLHELVNALADKFDEHKEVLAAVEEEEEESEETDNTKELMEKFSKVPDPKVAMKLMCGIGALKILLTRAKIAGVDPKDFPGAQNCHATCAHLVELLPVLKKGESPAIDVATVKANVKADYTCIKGHVQGLKAAFDQGKEEYEKTKEVDAHGSMVGLMLLDHVFEALMIRGQQLHACSRAMLGLAGKPVPAPEPKENRQMRELVAAFKKLA